MKTLLALSLFLVSAAPASAQDARGRDRRPPSSGGGRTGGSQGGSQGGGRTGGSEPTRRDPNTGGGWRQPQGRDTGERTTSGAARRRNPTPSPSDGWQAPPSAAPDRDDRGAPLGHAVRRPSPPPRQHWGPIGGYDPRRWDERERGRYYWHHYNGHRYCHYIDHHGVSWYYWYFDDGYYTMRWHDGHWWHHDGRRWVHYRDGDWYGHDHGYPSGYRTGDASLPKTEQRGLELTANLGHFGLSDGGAGSVIAENQTFLNFDGQMGGVAAGAELNIGLSRHLEAGVGVGYQSASVNTNYTEYVNANGREISQNLRLRNIPVNANLKVMPFGRDQAIQPYLGAGIQANAWNYQERGQFIDFNSANYDIYEETYKANGVAVGPVAIAGAKVAINDKVALGLEYRRQWAKGKLPVEQGFAGDHIDLGGSAVTAGVTIRLK